MNDAHLLAGLRTPYGRLNGALAAYDSMQLAERALRALHQRHRAVEAADGAMFGMIMQAGYGPSPARTAMYRSGIGTGIPALTLNNACLAGVDSVADATRRIERREGHLYLVGGFDSSSNAPLITSSEGSSRSALEQDSLTCAITGESMTELSDRRNAELGISRKRQDEWAVESHRRAALADLRSTGEVMVFDRNGEEFTRDEGIRDNSTIERVSQLEPVVPGGTITAANASQISDGAAVGIVGDLVAAERYGLAPLARIAGWGYAAGPDATLHDQPVQATRDLLKRVDMSISDIDLFEINEAFAGVVIHAVDALGISADIVNPNGGAIAIGHPYGGTGLRLVLTLAHELQRRDLRRGIATLCGAGGQGIALLLDRTTSKGK